MTKIPTIPSSLQPKGNHELLQFPCKFSIKVMGIATDDFEHFVVNRVRHYSQDINAVTLRTSRGGKYLSVTVTFNAQSRDQLDALYRELSSHERVTMVL